MVIILLILPLFLFSCLYWKQTPCWRTVILLSTITWGTLITASTEFLSLVNGLTFNFLFAFWFLINLSLIFIYRFKINSQVKFTGIQAKNFPYVYITCIVGIIATLGVISLASPPNNWDSMVYHMPRVEHWIQNRSVHHYPTAIPRQLYQGPWPAYAVTQLRILSGSDRFANLVQWLGMSGSVIGVSLIAKQLGASSIGQIYASIFCVTIPMGILQSSSTQTDYVISFWLVCFTYFAIDSIVNYNKSKNISIVIGISLGLAILSKGTAYIYAFPFLAWWSFSMIRLSKRDFWQQWLGVGATVIALNLGHYLRNFQTFGSILGASDDYTNQIINFKVVVSNLIRNLALHLSTPIRSINLIIIGAVTKIHQVIGIDVNSPMTTFPPGQKFDLHSLINHEDLAGNLIHLLIILTSFGIIANYTIRKRNANYKLLGYALACVSGFVLFCTLLTWSPWRSRLHLPIFVLFSGLIGVIFSELVSRRLAKIAFTCLLISSLLWVGFNETRPIFFNSKVVESNQIKNIFNTTRHTQYFASIPKLEQPYTEATSFIKNHFCKKIGLIFGGLNWEYPIWINFDNNVRIEHINVVNVTSKIAKSKKYSSFVPCAIISDNKDYINRQSLLYHEMNYLQVLNVNNLAVFLNNDAA